jgi:hypothetical protein
MSFLHKLKSNLISFVQAMYLQNVSLAPREFHLYVIYMTTFFVGKYNSLYAQINLFFNSLGCFYFILNQARDLNHLQTINLTKLRKNIANLIVFSKKNLSFRFLFLVFRFIYYKPKFFKFIEYSSNS